MICSFISARTSNPLIGLGAHFECFLFKIQVGWFGSPDGEIFPCSWVFYVILSQGIHALFAHLQFSNLEKYLEKTKSFQLSRKWLPNYSDWFWGPVKQHIPISSRPLSETSYPRLSHREEKPPLLGLPAPDRSHRCQPELMRALVSYQLKVQRPRSAGLGGITFGWLFQHP